MRVLVTGASGYLGQYVVRHLIEQDYSVCALIRKEKDKTLFDQLDCRFAIGDIQNADSIIQAAEKYDAIVHCAALISASSAEDFIKVNVDGTHNVVKAVNANDTQHLIILSSVGVYGGPDAGLARDESTVTNPQNQYAKSKLKAETVAKEKLLPDKKLTILRPTGFYGPARPLYIDLVKRWKKNPFLVSLEGDEIVHPCHIADLSNVIERALAIPPKQHRTLVVAGERSLGLRELYAELAKHMGIHLRYIIIPRWLATPAIRLLYLLGKISSDRFKLLLSRAQGTSLGAQYDTSKIKSELNINWIPVNEGMEKMAKTLR